MIIIAAICLRWWHVTSAAAAEAVAVAACSLFNYIKMPQRQMDSHKIGHLESVI